jgi:hypothetical protein
VSILSTQFSPLYLIPTIFLLEVMREKFAQYLTSGLTYFNLLAHIPNIIFNTLLVMSKTLIRCLRYKLHEINN